MNFMTMTIKMTAYDHDNVHDVGDDNEDEEENVEEKEKNEKEKVVEEGEG